MDGNSGGEATKNLDGDNGSEEINKIDGSSAGEEANKIDGSSGGEEAQKMDGNSDGEEAHKIDGSSGGEEAQKMDGSSDGEEAQKMEGERSSGDSIKIIVEQGECEPELEERMKEVLELDDQEEFVKLMNSLTCEEGAVQVIVSYMFKFDSVKCVAALLEGKLNESAEFDLRSVLSKSRSSPLHEAATCGALDLTAYLLNHGEDANVKVANRLPLYDAISEISLGNWWDGWVHDKSAFKLVSILCSFYQHHALKVVRLLASRTNDVDKEMVGFMMNGQLIELGVLLLCGYSLPPEALQLAEKAPEKEATLRLIEVFQRIGDNLVAYAKIDRPDGVMCERVVTELATLFEDGALPVTSRDTPIYDEDFYVERPGAFGKNQLFYWNVHRGLDRDKSLFPVCIGGFRSYHSSSVLKPLKVLSTQMKSQPHVVPTICGWRKCAQFMATAKRVVRYL